MASDLPDVFIRFEGVKGGSLDPTHPGDLADTPASAGPQGSPPKDGWIGIKRFSFGFGWGGSESSSRPLPSAGKGDNQEARLKAIEEQNKALHAQINAQKQPPPKKAKQ